MESLTVVAAASYSLPNVALFPKFNKINLNSHFSRCTAERSGVSMTPVSKALGNNGDVEKHQNHVKSTSNEIEERHNDIWELFKEAQKNILLLNKQRLLAMEELDRVKSERDSLLDSVNQLESINPINPKRDKLSVCAELLLRIDSLVINGGIGSTEASDLRRLVMDSRVSSEDYCGIVSKKDDEFLAELRHLSKKSNKNGFHIIHISTEMWPVVSVGSLASYVTGLSRALQRKGNLVEVILPRYASLNYAEVQALREVETEFYSYFNGQLHGNKIWTGVVFGIAVTFIQPIYYSSLFSQQRVYGCPNDFERFSYFSRASLDYLVKSGKRPDVLHIHNWQTAIVAPLFWDVFVNQGFEETKIVLTCQDFDSQGLEQPEKLVLCGLDPSRLHRPDRLQDNNNAHLVNILKAGIVYSNKVITMSSVQPKSQIISALEHGLEPTLVTHKEKLAIAPHGFDMSVWDPSRDNCIPQSYSEDDMNGKSVCKVTLQRRLNLPDEASEILVGCIFSSISDVDLEKLRTLVRMSSRRGVQFIFMGSGQSPNIKRAFELFQEELKNENVRFIDEYDEELSHLIISGSDIMLCLSSEDPLLQVPLKAMKYGTAPIPLHNTENTFRQYGGRNIESSGLSCYITNAFGNMSLSHAIDEIINNSSQWNRRIRESMLKDFSWDSECSDIHVSAYESVKRL